MLFIRAAPTHSSSISCSWLNSYNTSPSTAASLCSTRSFVSRYSKSRLTYIEVSPCPSSRIILYITTMSADSPKLHTTSPSHSDSCSPFRTHTYLATLLPQIQHQLCPAALPIRTLQLQRHLVGSILLQTLIYRTNQDLLSACSSKSANPRTK